MLKSPSRLPSLLRTAATSLLLLLCALTATAQTCDSRDTTQLSHLALRANLVRWLTLTPNLGLEYRLAPRWAVVADYTWGNYSFRSSEHRYALSEATAELRHRLGHKGYVGACAVTGQFNYQLSTTGRQGNHRGVGLSAGCLLPLSRQWQLDLGGAAGWLWVSKGEHYQHQDGLEVWHTDFSRKGLSPLALRASLVYTFPTKGGGQ